MAASIANSQLQSGKATQEKHNFRVGDMVSGVSEAVVDPRIEVAEFYKTSRLKVNERSKLIAQDAAPWLGTPPLLPIYRERGHRRLDSKTYSKDCIGCIWGCEMPVELIIDPWKPQAPKKYRNETFCYGPKSCRCYKAGPKRIVPGRKAWMRYTEEDWIDEEATDHRGADE